MSNPAVAYVGDYSFVLSDLDDNGRKRYVMAVQRGKSVLDKELTEEAYRGLDIVKRYLEKNIGNTAFGTSFKIMQDADTNSNFRVTGGTVNKPAVLIVKGFPLVLFGDITYKQQGSGGSLTDDFYTETTIPAISVPGADRVDTVYVDTYLAEVSCEAGSEYLDASLKDVSLSVQTANRFRIVQDILVAEGTTSIPVDGYDVSNVYHRYYKLAEISRHAANPNILQADITDTRKVTSTLESISDGTGNIDVSNATVENDLTVKGDVIVQDITHTHSEKLSVTCSTNDVNAVEITKSGTQVTPGDHNEALLITCSNNGSRGVVINKPDVTDLADALVISHTRSASNAIHVANGMFALPTGSAINDISSSTSLGTSNASVPTQNAVKVYVDTRLGGGFGTVNRIARFNANPDPTIENSNLTDDNTTLTINLHSVLQQNSYAANGVGFDAQNTDATGWSYVRADGPFASSGLSINSYLDSVVGQIFGINKLRTNHLLSTSDANALFIEQQGAKPIYIGNNGSTVMSINSAGYVGIATTNASYPFDVENAAFFGGLVGINTPPTDPSYQFAVQGPSVFYDDVNLRATLLLDNSFASAGSFIAPTSVGYDTSHILLANDYDPSAVRWRVGLINTEAGDVGSDLFISGQIGAGYYPAMVIRRQTGFIGVGTDFADYPFTATFSIYGSHALQLYGPGAFSIGASINWSDYSTYITEYDYSKLAIGSTYGVRFDTVVGIGTEPDVSYKLLVNANAIFTDSSTTSVNINSSSYAAPIATINNIDSEVQTSFTPSDVNLLYSTIDLHAVFEQGEAILFSSIYVGNLPLPLTFGTLFYVSPAPIVGPTAYYIAATRDGAFAGSYITLSTVGTCPSFDVNKRKFIKHSVLASGFGSSYQRWCVGLSNTESGSNKGSDFCLRYFDDSGVELSRVKPLVIKRSNGFIGIANDDPQYTLDVGSVYSNSRFSGTVYVGRIMPASNSYSAIGDGTAYFPNSYLSAINATSIKGKTVAQGGDGYLRLDLTQGPVLSESNVPGSPGAKVSHYVLGVGSLVTNARWNIGLINNETGFMDGSDLIIEPMTNGGLAVGPALTIKRSDGKATFNYNVCTLGNFVAIPTAPSPDPVKFFSVYTGSDASTQLRWTMGLQNLPSGGNVGDDLALWNHDDAGSEIGPMVSFNRSDSRIDLNNLTRVNQNRLRLVGSNATANAVSLDVVDHYLVVGYSDGVRIFDVSNPTNPIVKGTYVPSQYFGDVKIAGKYAYCAGTGSSKILDISNPSSISVIASIHEGGAIAVQGKWLHVGRSYPTTAEIYNITVTSTPTLERQYPAEPVDAFFVQGDTVFAAANTDGLRIYDVSSLIISNPTLIGGITEASGSRYASGIWVQDKYAYLANGGDGVRIYDVSDITSPQHVSQITLVGANVAAMDVKVSGNYLFIAAKAGGLLVYDISNPASPALSGSVSDGTWMLKLAISGRYVYGASHSGGLKIFELSGLESPSINAGSLDVQKINAGNIRVRDNLDVNGNVSIASCLQVKDIGVLNNMHIASRVIIGNQDVDTYSGRPLAVIGRPVAEAWDPYSDVRLKKNVESITTALDKIKGLRGVTFEWIDPQLTKGKQYGLIAQEVEQVVPELVYAPSSDSYKTVSYNQLTAILAEAVKTLSDKVDALQGEVRSLKGNG